MPTAAGTAGLPPARVPYAPCRPQPRRSAGGAHRGIARWAGFGLAAALSSARRKLIDALPELDQGTTEAAQRFLVDPEIDLLSHRRGDEQVAAEILIPVRRAVISGHRLRIRYLASGQPARWRTVDPIGLVTTGGRVYLLATRSGAERTYRLSRIRAVQELAEPADRADHIDLDQAWRDRASRFLSDTHLTALVRVRSTRRDELADMAFAVRSESDGPAGWRRLEVVFQDLWHAEWALWRLGVDAEALRPPTLRGALHDRAAALSARYRDDADPAD